MFWKIEIEHTREGLDGVATFRGAEDDWRNARIPHADLSGLKVDIDNGIFVLTVYPNSEGGYNVSFYKCEEEICSDGVTTDWEELENDQD